MKRLTPAFKRFVVLRNPVSTNAEQVQRRIQELHELFPETLMDIIETSAAGKDGTRRRLSRHAHLLGPHTLLCIGGGDGTTNLAVEWLVQGKGVPAAARKTPILPLWGGNANDLAHMLNGVMYRGRLKRLFAKAKIVKVYPLQCHLAEQNTEPRVHVAVGYIGFGITAAVALQLNAAEHRHSRWRTVPGVRFIGELITLFQTLLGSTSFAIEEKGNVRHLLERSYVNGSRMGKLRPIATRLTDKTFIETDVHRKDRHVFAIWRWLKESMRPRPTHKISKSSTFSCRDTLWMQVDGEPARVAKGTQVTVSRSAKPFYALSTQTGKLRS
ncbi:MAG TPA: diacylglycerol kinase family protein [Candidatus Saccharimonadales bacterium]|nr:diacylglycerol kinase family protein [Candidatus Saccharimonadales bacterium]